MITAKQKLDCVERELKLRRRIYRNRIETGRMTPRQAQYEIAVMEAIKDDYAAQAEKERLL